MAEDEQMTQVVPFSTYSLAINEDYHKELSPREVCSHLVEDEEVKEERPRLSGSCMFGSTEHFFF